MSCSEFEIYYASTTQYDSDFLEQCSRDPCVLTKIEDGKCYISLIVTEQEIRAGKTSIPHFLDTREETRNMTLITNPRNPSTPWKRVLYLPKHLTEEIMQYIDVVRATQ